MSDDFEQQEYLALVKTVDDFDQRLITIKGWGVSLSLVALGLGFQYRAYGFFLVAAASSGAFWLIEGVIKRHQMRYYPRMRAIEMNRYRIAAGSEGISSPRIDWSWEQAGAVFGGKPFDVTNSQVSPTRKTLAYRYSWLLPHVMLPHVVTLLIGVCLFLLGHVGHLAQFTLGATNK